MHVCRERLQKLIEVEESEYTMTAKMVIVIITKLVKTLSYNHQDNYEHRV